MKKILLTSLAFVQFVLLFPQNEFLDSPEAYYGQTKPGNTPVVFAAGTISQGSVNTCSFSPDGKEMVFTRWTGDNPQLVYTNFDGVHWTTPVEKSFTGNKEMEAIFAPYGKQMFFASGASFPDDIWMVEKNDSTWKTPGKVNVISTTGDVEFYATLTLDTTMYFQRTYTAIYCSKYKNGAFSTPVKLGNTINTSTGVSRHPCISKDGSYLLFEKGDGSVNDDIWISFQKADKTWSNAVAFGNKINTTQFECQPTLSPDEKYLFFRRSNIIYWARIDNQIDSLRHSVFNLSASSNALNINAPANSMATFNITSGTTWNISCSEAWLTVSNTSGENNATITLTAEANPGANSRTATMKVNGWGTDTLIIDVTQSAGTNMIQINTNDNLEIYPNPTSGIIDIFIDNPSENHYKVEVFNSLGVILQTAIQQKGEGAAQVDLSGYPASIYLIRIKSKNEFYQSRVLKK